MVQRPGHNLAPCAKRVRRDPVDRDQPVVGDPNLGDVGFHDGFALAEAAAAEDVTQAPADPLDRRVVGRLDFFRAAEFRLPGGELVEPGLEFIDAAPADRLVESAVLKGAHIAVDRGLRGGDLPGEAVELGPVLGGAGHAELVLVGDGGPDQLGAGVEVGQRVSDGGIELIRVDARGGAALTAVTDAREAGVVAVATEFAGRSGADEFAAALRPYAMWTSWWSVATTIPFLTT
jgi:hypothetical protein